MDRLAGHFWANEKITREPGGTAYWGTGVPRQVASKARLSYEDLGRARGVHQVRAAGQLGEK